MFILSYFPKISVCIPIYNGSKYLDQCLESVVRQTLTDYEVILVDDGSTDNSLEIANHYVLTDKRFRLVINDSNLGLVENWNKCIRIANGHWIKFLFQDDYLEPSCLEEFVSRIDEDVSFIVCRRKLVFDDVKLSVKRSYRHFIKKHSLDVVFKGQTKINSSIFSEAIYKLPGINFIGEPTAVLFRKDLIGDVGDFDRNLVQICDLEYWTRIACNYGLVYIPKTLATFRVHSGATSAKNKQSIKFRSDTIDRLILFNKYVKDPAYLHLRKSTNIKRNFTMSDIYTLEGVRAIAYAKKNIRTLSDLSSSPMQELFNYYERYGGDTNKDSSVWLLSYIAPIVSYRRRLSMFIYSILKRLL